MCLGSGRWGGPLQQPTWGISYFPSLQLHALKLEVLVLMCGGQVGGGGKRIPSMHLPLRLKLSLLSYHLGLLHLE